MFVGLPSPRSATWYLRRQVGRRLNRYLGVDVMAEDWDVLVVLDACRYDTFRAYSDLRGRLETRRSRGAATEEFVEHNFRTAHHDTVYVTANPHVTRLAADRFHDIRNVWQSDWDDDLNTVRPEPVVKTTLDVATEYPDKRIVVHFMQPHHPFIGKQARAELPMVGGNQHAVDGKSGAPTVWEYARRGEVETEAIQAAYRENLQVVLPHVQELVETVTGRTVVTSDHGNLFAEQPFRVSPLGRPRFSHPPGCTAKPLVTVPWLVCPSSDRRPVTESPPEQSELNRDLDSVQERLAALGYR